MAAFRTKPLVKQAVQFEGFNADGKPLFECFNEGPPRWLQKAMAKGLIFTKGGRLFVSTIEGVSHAPRGSYIVRGVKGEIYPCDPSVFESSYEALRSLL